MRDRPPHARVLGLVAGMLLAQGSLAAAPPPARLRVVSWNIAALGDPNGVVETLRRLRPNVVALQEVDVRTQRSGGVDQVAMLAAALGMVGHFAPTMDFDGGQYGLAVLTPKNGGEVIMQAHRLPRQGSEEPRVAMQVDFWGISLFNTHLTADWHTQDPAPLRLAQAEALARVVSQNLQRGGRVLLVGDLNCTPQDAPFARLAAVLSPVLNTTPTYPAHLPARVIDHVMVGTPAGLAAPRSTLWVEDTVASDHRVLVWDLEWPSRAGAP